MKKIKIAAILLVAGMLSLLVGCSALESLFHEHTVVYEDAVPVTCTTNGLTAGSYCSTCGAILTAQRVISATGHKFGNWLEEDNRTYRECSACSYREVKSGSGQGSGETDGNQIVGSYGNFDLFLRDCKVSENKLNYQGAQNRIEVNLRTASARCDGYTFVVPSRMMSINFIGEAKGNPYRNFHIEIASRSEDIDISFEDVKIESETTIFTSETRNIDVNITISGVCGFVITGTGQKGKDGATANGNYPPEKGGDGEDGQNAMIINGQCEIVCKSGASLEIKGGNGGNGGKGGAAGEYNGAGTGNGGNGGRGGNAVLGEFLVKVRAYPNCVLALAGGLGGEAGKQGNGNFWTQLNGNHGRDGEKGADGDSGCQIIYFD